MSPARRSEGHIDYYRSYIAEEMQNGKSEKEVMDLLGDPWVIARSIIDSPLNETEEQYAYTDYEEADQEPPYGTPEIKFKKITGWKIAAVCVGIVLILTLVISLITGLISMLAPAACPASCDLDCAPYHTESQAVSGMPQKKNGKKWREQAKNSSIIKDRWGSQRSFEGSINN